MKYENRNYPHPVLGSGTDIDGEFFTSLTVKSNTESTILNPIVTLNNMTLEALIDSGDASYMMQVYCRGTMYRESFQIKDPISDSFKISTEVLSGETEVDFFICAEKILKNYINSDSSSTFEKATFNIQKGYILAYGGKGTFYANKSPERLKAISSFMRIKNGDFEIGAFKLDLSENKFITIELSKKDYEMYHMLKSDSINWGVLHASIVFPALVEVAYLIGDDNSGISDMKDTQWYTILFKILEKSKGNSLLEKVQNILDLPLNRALIDLDPEENS